MPTNRKLFVNLAVEDLDRSIVFFTRLGFEFDEAFTDATATCVLIGGDAYAMLLVKPRFAGFANKQMCDPYSRSFYDPDGHHCEDLSTLATRRCVVSHSYTRGRPPR